MLNIIGVVLGEHTNNDYRHPMGVFFYMGFFLIMFIRDYI